MLGCAVVDLFRFAYGCVCYVSVWYFWYNCFDDCLLDNLDLFWCLFVVLYRCY